MSALIGNPLLLSDEGYQINRSVRLRSSASAYFNRTPASAGSRQRWTYSKWIKRGTVGVQQVLLSSTNSSNDAISFTSGDNIQIQFANQTAANIISTAVYRDPSAWYHVVVSVDTTQATSSSRVQLFVNGQQVTAFGTANYPSQNYSTWIDGAFVHNIGQVASVQYFDGYLTEINFIDGQALTPASFGETDAITGVWKPKKYTGTYGTNGFYLNFSDPSAATAAAIGKDYSGNGNNWTPNNISVTSGATYDSMLDVPTLWADGGNGRGNYATLNPLANPSTLSAANLTTTGGDKWSISTIGMTSGKWYAEATVTTVGAESSVGIANASYSGSNAYVGGTATSWGYAMNGNKYTSSSGSAYGATYTSGDVVGIAFDADNGTLEFFKNGTTQGIAYSSLTSGPYFFAVEGRTSTSANNISINFGQRPFAYTPPSGFKALNTGNLPEPVIKKGNAWFDATTYTGTGATQSITNSGSMQPDLVWLKTRSTISSNLLYDAQRGALNYLSSNQTAAEASLANSLTAFNSNGFALGSDGNVNGNGTTFIAWQWKEGATPGFDIVTYTGTGANATVGHGLGVAPAMMIIKNRSTTDGWLIYHQSIGNTNFLDFTTAASAAASSAWNNTSPTSSVFTVGTSSRGNGNTNSIVAYLFAAVTGYSAFGSYTGNGSTDGPFVFCGFRPRYVLIKQSDAATNWIVMDSARSPTNTIPDFLLPNASNAESTSSASNIDFTSNGFKIRNSNSDRNTNGSTYIFAAFAENPFKYSLAR